MKSTNGDSCLQELSDMRNSEDVCVDKPENLLKMLVDVIRVELSEVVPALEPFVMPWHIM